MQDSPYDPHDHLQMRTFNAYSKDNHALHWPHDWSSDNSTATMDNQLAFLPETHMHADMYSDFSSRSSFAESVPSSSKTVSYAHHPTTDDDSALYLTNTRGEIVPINLRQLEATPDHIISTLTHCARHPVDCGKWMMIGATYRGRGNVQAAIAVITSMIEGWRPLARDDSGC